MSTEKKYQVTLTQGELDEIHRSLYQLDGILCELDGSALSNYEIISVERHIELDQLAERLFEQTHDDNGDWL